MLPVPVAKRFGIGDGTDVLPACQPTSSPLNRLVKAFYWGSLDGTASTGTQPPQTASVTTFPRVDNCQEEVGSDHPAPPVVDRCAQSVGVDDAVVVHVV